MTLPKRGTPDDDWLFPDHEAPSAEPQPTPFGVLRFESWDARPVEYDTLTRAILAGLPHTPGALICLTGGRGLLAHASERGAEWRMTESGELQVVREAAAAKRARDAGRAA